MNDDTEKLLREYLDYHRDAEREGMGTRNLYDLMQKVVDQQMQHNKDDEGRFDEIKDELGAIRGDLKGQSLRIGVLEKHIDKVEKEVETTGEHNVLHLTKQLEEMRRKDIAHAEFVRNTIVSIVLLVLGSVVTYVFAKGAK